MNSLLHKSNQQKAYSFEKICVRRRKFFGILKKKLKRESRQEMPGNQGV
jgi:hypothetical protein